MNDTYEAEKQWRKTLYRPSTQELLQIFPEAKSSIEHNLKLYRNRMKVLKTGLTLRMNIYKKLTKDEFSLWFYRQWLETTTGKEVTTLQKRITTLQRQLNALNGVIDTREIIDDLIQQAKEVPIEQIVDTPLKQSGQRLVGLCVLHEERRASFVIYKQTNTCWCFGCQQGGDSIKLTQLLHGYSFPQAVRYLTHTT
ncbi:MAG: hypothetical protein HYV32_03075 [Candidatus Kerfeldbacteria bacterium]|nr:hypothetical protein [Candidatus Kerfeldbacteria bacterium]